MATKKNMQRDVEGHGFRGPRITDEAPAGETAAEQGKAGEADEAEVEGQSLRAKGEPVADVEGHATKVKAPSAEVQGHGVRVKANDEPAPDESADASGDRELDDSDVEGHGWRGR